LAVRDSRDDRRHLRHFFAELIDAVRALIDASISLPRIVRSRLRDPQDPETRLARRSSAPKIRRRIDPALMRFENVTITSARPAAVIVSTSLALRALIATNRS
jgi:hypothetical protein